MMPTSGESRPLATLWTLAWDQDRLACVIYRTGAGMLQLKIESADAVVIAERFEIQPRAVARAQALRHALKRRGWREA